METIYRFYSTMSIPHSRILAIRHCCRPGRQMRRSRVNFNRSVNEIVRDKKKLLASFRAINFVADIGYRFDCASSPVLFAYSALSNYCFFGVDFFEMRSDDELNRFWRTSIPSEGEAKKPSRQPWELFRGPAAIKRYRKRKTRETESMALQRYLMDLRKVCQSIRTDGRTVVTFFPMDFPFPDRGASPGSSVQHPAAAAPDLPVIQRSNLLCPSIEADPAVKKSFSYQATLKDSE